MSGDAKKLLFFSLEDWDDIWRRNQFVVSLLLRRHRDLEVLWVNTPRDARRHPQYYPLCLQGPQTSAESEHLKVLSTIKVLPNSVGESINAAVSTNQIQRALKQLQWGSSWGTWVNDTVASAIVRRLGHPEQFIYDITDDWLHADLPERSIRRLERDDTWLCNEADAVIVCSPDLQRSRQSKSSNVSLIPNGVHFDLYKPETLSRLSPPAEAATITGPIAGYVGTLHEDRLDVELLLAATKQAPELNLVFVGPNCLRDENTQRLVNTGRIHILGARPYSEVPVYLSWFDVCIVPHRITPFTESLDPLKLYEFMATGRPIVATACAGFREQSALIEIADESNFGSKILAATVADATTSSAARVSWAKEHSWEKRVEAIEKILGWDS